MFPDVRCGRCFVFFLQMFCVFAADVLWFFADVFCVCWFQAKKQAATKTRRVAGCESGSVFYSFMVRDS